MGVFYEDSFLKSFGNSFLLLDSQILCEVLHFKHYVWPSSFLKGRTLGLDRFFKLSIFRCCQIQVKKSPGFSVKIFWLLRIELRLFRFIVRDHLQFFSGKIYKYLTMVKIEILCNLWPNLKNLSCGLNLSRGLNMVGST